MKRLLPPIYWNDMETIMIFGAFAGDVSLYGLLEQCVPPIFLHCIGLVLFSAVLGTAVALLRMRLAAASSSQSTDERAPSE